MREPVLTHTPMVADSTSGISSVITLIPLFRAVFWIKDISA